MRNLGRLVAAYRQTEGMSYRRLAELSGIDLGSLYRFLHQGQPGPTCEKLSTWTCDRLGEVLRKWRLLTDQTEVSVSQQIGISPVELQMIEGGAPLPQSVFSKVLRWMMER